MSQVPYNTTVGTNDRYIPVMAAIHQTEGGGNRIGERLCELPLSLRSDPDYPGLQCPPFKIVYASGDESVFDNGMPAPAIDWIADHAPLIFDARNAFNSYHRDNVVRL